MHHSQFNPSLSFNDDKLMMGRCQEMVNYFPSLKWVGMCTEEDPLIHLFNEKHKRDDCISAYRVATAPSCVNTYPCAGGVLTKFNERDNHPCVTMECILSLVNCCMYLYYFIPITQMVWRVVILFMGPLVFKDFEIKQRWTYYNKTCWNTAFHSASKYFFVLYFNQQIFLGVLFWVYMVL